MYVSKEWRKRNDSGLQSQLVRGANEIDQLYEDLDFASILHDVVVVKVGMEQKKIRDEGYDPIQILQRLQERRRLLSNIDFGEITGKEKRKNVVEGGGEK